MVIVRLTPCSTSINFGIYSFPWELVGCLLSASSRVKTLILLLHKSTIYSFVEL